MLILSWSIKKHGRHRQFLFLIGRFLKIFFSETAWPKWTEIWWEAPMEGSVLSFLKAEWKVSDAGSAHWASSLKAIWISIHSCWGGHFGRQPVLNENTIYLQNMSIKCCLGRCDQKPCVFVVFCVQFVSQHHLLCMSQFPSYMCNCTLEWLWTLNASFNSIQWSCKVVYGNFFFIIIRKTSFLFLFLAESVKILVRLHRQTFFSATTYFVNA